MSICSGGKVGASQPLPAISSSPGLTGHKLPPHIIPTRTPPCQPRKPEPPRTWRTPDPTGLCSIFLGPAPLLAQWPGRQAPPSPGAARPGPTSAWQACLVSLMSRAQEVPGGVCHGHGDSTAALGDAPRGSVAGTRVQHEDKQGPSQGTPLLMRSRMCTFGLASGTSGCQHLPERNPQATKKNSFPCHSSLRPAWLEVPHHSNITHS